ncbi:MAG: FAD-dependent oxidoreductase, partial [Granulosicoccaceae bacterium]
MSSKLFTRGGFAYPATSMQFKTGTWRVQKPVHQYKHAPCHAACPAGEDPQAYIAKLYDGHLQQAWETLVAANPLPAITGRVCHHPCETGCNRGQYDEAVAIHSIERFLGDQAIEHNWPYPVEVVKDTDSQVAVVGAGPAGLSCAYHLTRLGHKVTLFTALGEAGGTLHAIPGYRLPDSVIEAEASRVLDIGIDFRPHHRLGRDIHIDELRQEFKAVFLAVGTQLAKDWSVAGVTPRDLHVGLTVLKEWMAVGSVPEAHSVAVVGGGNTAVDLSRVLKRAGIPEVHIITSNGLPSEDAAATDLMRAVPREIEQALEEGVIIHPHRGIRRLLLRGEQVVGLEMVHMKKMPAEDGGFKRIAFEGTETVLHVDQVIPAIGQVINPIGLESLLEGEPVLQVDQFGQIPGHAGLFAGGDACNKSGGTVTAAVGD